MCSATCSDIIDHPFIASDMASDIKEITLVLCYMHAQLHEYALGMFIYFDCAQFFKATSIIDASLRKFQSVISLNANQCIFTRYIIINPSYCKIRRQ